MSMCNEILRLYTTWYKVFKVSQAEELHHPSDELLQNEDAAIMTKAKRSIAVRRAAREEQWYKVFKVSQAEELHHPSDELLQNEDAAIMTKAKRAIAVRRAAREEQEAVEHRAHRANQLPKSAPMPDEKHRDIISLDSTEESSSIQDSLPDVHVTEVSDLSSLSEDDVLSEPEPVPAPDMADPDESGEETPEQEAKRLRRQGKRVAFSGTHLGPAKSRALKNRKATKGKKKNKSLPLYPCTTYNSFALDNKGHIGSNCLRHKLKVGDVVTLANTQYRLTECYEGPYDQQDTTACYNWYVVKA